MTANEFRQAALCLDGVQESEHMSHPDFRYGGKVIASLNAAGTEAMVKLFPEDQALLILQFPGVFRPASGAWGRSGCTMILLELADPEDVVLASLKKAWVRAST